MFNNCLKTRNRETIQDEMINFNYLEEFQFGKNLEKLSKKLKNKKVLIYGAGALFETINKYYDIDILNIIGISDIKFKNHKNNETFLGFKVYSPDEIVSQNPDFVLVSTKYYMGVMAHIYYDILKNTKIKIKPLVKKPCLTLLKEVWR